MIVYEFLKNSTNGLSAVEISTAIKLPLFLIRKELKRLEKKRQIYKSGDIYKTLPIVENQIQHERLISFLTLYIALSYKRYEKSDEHNKNNLQYKFTKKIKEIANFVRLCDEKEANELMVLSSVFYTLDKEYCLKTYKTVYPPINVFKSKVIWVWYNKFINHTLQLKNMEVGENELITKDYVIWKSLGCPRDQNLINMFKENNILNNNFKLLGAETWLKKKQNH